MSDQNFHEIQLSKKQLFFLFMCAVVLTVVVFLFGVSVGRQVQTSAADAAPTAPAATDSPVENTPTAAPAPTQTAANELSYAEALEGKDPSKATPPPPAAEEAPAAPKTEPAKAEPPKAEPAKAAPAPSKEVPKAVPAANGWVVQVGAFNANDVAAREVAKLQGKGYPAFVFAEAENVPGLRYKVRVGPYSARAEADRMLRNLSKEGYKPFLKR